VLTVLRRDRNQPLALDEALDLAREHGGRLLVNAKSHRAAVHVSAPSVMLDDGAIERRVRLVRPMERPALPADSLATSAWEEADKAAFAEAWHAEVAELPAFAESHLTAMTTAASRVLRWNVPPYRPCWLRLFAPPDVIAGAEAVLKAIVEVLLKPSIELRQLARGALSKSPDPNPFLTFSLTCRADLDHVRRTFG
jgi:hypothetical protein